MKNVKKQIVSKSRRNIVTLAAIAAVARTGASVFAGTTGSAETVSTAGSTALKNWLVANTTTFTDVQPGTQLSIQGVNYPSDPSAWAVNRTDGTGILAYQIAPASYNGGATITGPVVDISPALRYEYHESGSVEGILELANDQIAPVTFVTQNVDRNPQGGTGNSVWVNYNQIGATKIQFNSNLSGGTVIGADTNTATPANNYHLGDFYNNNQLFMLNGNAQPAFNTAGGNINGGQNAVQLALSDAIPLQVFAAPTMGTDTHLSTPWFRTPQDANYGQGNIKLSNATLGTANLRAVYQPTSYLNMPATAINPRTGAAFGNGSWNAAGLGNLNSTTAAITATMYVANPGTGLTQVNQTDGQYLLTLGRLKNGATFNMTTRDVNSGTRNVISLETGVDPTYSVGVNDNGNGNLLSGGVGQVQIGSAMRFSNKTAGGALLRPTVQANRMAVGMLSINDANGNTLESSANPIRALKFSASTDGSQPYVLANYFTISGTNTSTGSYTGAGGADSNPNGQQYAIFQNEQFITLKAPDANYSSGSPNIQGDNSTSDVKSLINNTLNSVTAYQASNGAASPAAGLLSQGYIIPQLMQVQKSQNGQNVAGTPGAIVANPNYNASLTSVVGFGTLVSKMNNDDPSTVFSGKSSSIYGGSTAYANGSPNFNGSIPLTSNNNGAGGNYLFGNFSQTGVRDFYSTVVQGQVVQNALETQVGNSAFNGSTGTGSNNSPVTTGISALDMMNSGSNATKGDLITMGDYYGTGKFDGSDLYAMAIGASLTDANARPTETTVAGVTTFTVNNAHITGGQSNFSTNIINAVLNKNVALDYLKSTATTAQKTEAAAILTGTTSNISTGVPTGATLTGTDAVSGFVQFTYDPTGANAFNKSDVNRDGVVDFNDALVVDQFNGKTYTSLSDSLSSTMPTPVTGTPELANLVLAQQIDTNTSIGASDLAVVNTALTGTGATNWYNYSGGAIKSGPGNISWNRSSSTVNLYTGASLQISSGTIQAITSGTDPFTDNNLNLPSSNTDTSKSLAVTVTTGGMLEYTSGGTGIQLDRLASLNVSGGTVTVDPAGIRSNRSLLMLGSLTVSVGSNIGLANNDSIIQSGNLAAVTALVKSGYANGNWKGSGISSVSAAADSTHLTALGVIQNSVNGSPVGTALYSTASGSLGLFDGVAPAAADVLVKYTYYGDTNLDGKVDGSDYSRIDASFTAEKIGPAISGWASGDFNYDGVVDGLDYTLLDNAFNQQGAQLTALVAAQPAAQISGTSAVPESASLGLLGIGLGSLLSRRTRRRA